MKVLRIRLRNYRGVADRDVAFRETGITIVEGVNEAGKTSLFQGLDMLLEKLDSSHDIEVRAAVPTHTDTGPEVEAEILTGEYRFTYRKRWHRHPETVLTVTHPRPEDLTGREAHARVRQIIASTVDENLWKALRITQADPVRQANLQDAAALGRALDHAAGGDPAGAGDHLDLYSRVRAEYERYFTAKQGKPTGEYVKAAAHAAATVEHARTCAADLDVLDHSVNEHERLTRQLAGLDDERIRHRNRLSTFEDQWRDLEKRQENVDRLEQHALRIQLEADQAAHDHEEREGLVAQVAGQNAALTSLRASHVDDQVALENARAEFDGADRARGRLQRELRETEARYIRANDDVDHMHDRAELETLTGRCGRATEAIDGVVQAKADMAAIRVYQALMSQLEAAHDRLVEARAELGAASGTILLEALSTVEVELDGARHELATNRPVERSLSELREVVVPGILRIQLRQGSGGRNLQDTVRQAQDGYETLCERAGVEDIRQARTAMDQRKDIEQRLLIFEQTLERDLDGQDIDDLRTRLATLTASTDHYLRTRKATTSLPTDLDSARAIAEQARPRVEGLRGELATAEQKARHLDDACHERAVAVRLADQKIADAEGRLAEFMEMLTSARQKESDEDLRIRYAQAGTKAANASERWRSAADDLATDNPDAVQALLANERALGNRLDEDISRTRTDQAKIEGILEQGRGAQEKLDEARSSADAAERILTNLRRRAEAANLLYDTLTRHRDQARRAYIRPFRDQILRLGRIVFGAGLDIDVDDHLRITNRTLGGITVGFDQLSSGAKEQLCLCARLACAELVDPADGVPLIIDDALGYTDSDRLALLGAVLNSSASHSQVIILTCMPERYRAVGHATTVSLRPSRMMPSRPESRRQPPPDDLERSAAHAPSGPAMTSPSGNVSDADAILRCLRDAGEALGRSEVVARTGINPDGWPQTIRALLDTGKVTQSGARRGAKYHVT